MTSDSSLSSLAVKRPRRADAQRNETRVRNAAGVAFARHGKGVTMEQVASEAEVSKGTVYNVFGSRDAMIELLTTAVLDEAARSYRQALRADDPWSALVGCVLTPTLGIAATNDLTSPDAPASSAKLAMDRCIVAMDGLLERAKTAGVVRSDVRVDHLITLFRGLYAVLPPYGERSPEYVHELGEIILRGIRR